MRKKVIEFIIVQRVKLELRRIAQIITVCFKYIFRMSDKKVLELKNSKNGKSCIIVGNGPSSRISDFDRLQMSNMDSFGANKIIGLFDKTIWRPTYLCVSDPYFLAGEEKTVNADEYVEKSQAYGIKKIFFTDVINNLLPKNFQKDKITFFNIIYSLPFSKHMCPFSNKLEYYCSDLGSVTHFAIQIAVYMGYSKIYIYGIDNTFKKCLDVDGKYKVNNSIQSHVEGLQLGKTDMHADHIPKNAFEAFTIGGFGDKRKCNIGYKKCLDYANKHNVEIINLTRGGELDVFKRESFDKIF